MVEKLIINLDTDLNLYFEIWINIYNKYLNILIL